MAQRPNRQQRRAKQVRRTNQRAAQRRQRPPTLDEITHRVLVDAARDVIDAPMLQVEHIASELAAPAWRTWLAASDEQLLDLASPALSSLRFMATQQHATDQRVLDTALALALVTIAHDLDEDEVQSEGAALVAALRASGARDPSWAGDVGSYEIGDAWLMRDPWSMRTDVIVEFRDPSGEAHTIVAMGDATIGHQLVDCHVDDPLASLLPRVQRIVDEADDERQRALTIVEQVAPAVAGGILHGFVEGTFEAYGDALVEGEDELSALSVFFARYALLRSKLMANQGDAWHTSPLSSDLDDMRAPQLLATFMGSDEFRAEPNTSERAAELITSWVDNHGPADRAQFGPLEVCDLVEDGLHGVTPDADDDDGASIQLHSQLLATVRAWARFAAAHAGVSDLATQLTLEAIDDQPLALLASMRGVAPEIVPNPGMTDRMVRAMIADGVEIGDQAAMDAWIVEFNKRPLNERDEIIDG